MKKRNFIIFLIIIFFFLAGSFYLGFTLTRANSIGEIKIDAPKAKAAQKLNKELSFPIKNAEGEEVAKVRYQIESAELYDTIIVKGQRARAVKGRTFLVINLKITNGFNQGIEINTRDYLRLSTNDGKEKLAADIHNDPLKVQAESTKPTRIGFAINESEKNVILYFGELNADKKQEIKITF